MLIIAKHVSAKCSGFRTAVWQAELLSAHLMQNIGLVPVTVSILWWFKTALDTEVTWANILTAIAEHGYVKHISVLHAQSHLLCHTVPF